MGEEMHYFVSDLYRDFECVADVCPSTCCAGWNINIDEQTYKKMIEHEEELGVKAKDWLVETDKCVRAKLVNGRCCMLNENNLCNVVLKLGPEYLSNTCTVYPRSYKKYGSIQEAYVTLSCPEVVKQLMERERIDFEFFSTDEEEPVYKYTELYLYASSVRSDLIGVVLEYPMIDLCTRVFACYQMIDKAIDAYQKGVVQYEVLAPALTPYLRDDILCSFEVQLKDVVKEEQRYQFLQKLKVVLTGDTENRDFVKYQDILKKYYGNTQFDDYCSDLESFRKEIQKYNIFYSNYWAYRMAQDILSIPKVEAVKDNLIYIAMEFCVIQMLALAVYAENKRVLSKEEYILLISHVARTMEHSRKFREDIIEMLKTNDVINLAGLMLMTFV